MKIKKDIEFIEINNKYLNILEDFNNLNKNYSQLEKDLCDMETVNIKLLDIIKNKRINLLDYYNTSIILI